MSMANELTDIPDRLNGQCDCPKRDGKPGEDLTGREQLVSNVLFSWMAHFVFVVAGFIMPRMIDQRLGQELLGIWDFSWSLVNYFGLVQAGLTSSVNRYVAKYRAATNISGVNQVVSSAFCILGIAGFFVLALTITVSLMLPQLFGTKLGNNVAEAQWVIFFLGTSLGIQIALSAFTGVMSGCHRWTVHNIIKSGWHIVTVVGMIIALLKGGGLPSLAVITFAGLALADLTRVVLAHRVCAGLRLRPSLVRRETISKLFVFGGKTLIPSVSKLLLNQTVSLLLMAYLGPAVLALYTRPRSLIHHMSKLVNKMAMTLTPTISSLQNARNMKGIGELLITSVRYASCMVVPMVLVLIVFGGPVLQFWMGPRYANGLVPAILAAGNLATVVQLPVLSVLAGLNAHGRAGMAQFVASLCSVGLTVLALGPLDTGLAGAAIAVTLPLTIVNLIYLPLLVCRRVGLDLSRYFLNAMVEPVVYTLPFAACLVVARIMFPAQPLLGLVWGAASGSVVLAIVYWRYVLPKSICRKIWARCAFAA